MEPTRDAIREAQAVRLHQPRIEMPVALAKRIRLECPCVYFGWESVTAILSEKGPEASERAHRAMVQAWLERGWCEKRSGVVVKQEVLFQHCLQRVEGR